MSTPNPLMIKTADEAVAYLLPKFKGMKKYAKEMDESEFAAFCHSQLSGGIGMKIRNELGLWGQNTDLIRFFQVVVHVTHPDDMSGLLIKEIYKHLIEGDKQSTFENKPIRALWWKQPYATLMLHGKIETRTWPTNYRGLVLICASKQPYTYEQGLHISGATQLQRIRKLYNGIPDDHYGQAIAVGELVDCRPMTKADEDACFVRYWDDLWCHVYQNVRAIAPFALKGAQGWRKLSDETLSQIKFI